MTSSMTSSEPPQKVLSLQKVSGHKSQYSGVRNFFSILRKKNQKWSKSTYKKKKKKKKKKKSGYQVISNGPRLLSPQRGSPPTSILLPSFNWPRFARSSQFWSDLAWWLIQCFFSFFPFFFSFFFFSFFFFSLFLFFLFLASLGWFRLRHWSFTTIETSAQQTNKQVHKRTTNK